MDPICSEINNLRKEVIELRQSFMAFRTNQAIHNNDIPKLLKEIIVLLKKEPNGSEIVTSPQRVDSSFAATVISDSGSPKEDKKQGIFIP